MKHLTLILLSLALYSCDGRTVTGSGHVTSETRKLGGFHEIALHAAADVYLTQGPETSVVVEAEDNILPYIIIEEEGGKLTIKQKDNTSYSTFHPIKVKVTTPVVTEVNVTGSGNVNLVNTIDNEQFLELVITGSGNIKGNIHTPRIKANIVGSGDITVSGETRDIAFDGNGSGDFNGKSLKAETATINISGSGDVNVNVSEKLDANTSGSGDIYYYGNPQVTTNKTGSGSVHKKD